MKHATTSQLYQLIGSEIIRLNQYLFPSLIQHDVLSQLCYKTKQVLEQKIYVRVEKEERLFGTKVETPTQVLAEVVSKSKIYSRNKAIKIAFQNVLDLEVE